jgi:hypothetical protein
LADMNIRYFVHLSGITRLQTRAHKRKISPRRMTL